MRYRPGVIWLTVFLCTGWFIFLTTIYFLSYSAYCEKAVTDVDGLLLIEGLLHLFIKRFHNESKKYFHIKQVHKVASKQNWYILIINKLEFYLFNDFCLFSRFIYGTRKILEMMLLWSQRSQSPISHHIGRFLPLSLVITWQSLCPVQLLSFHCLLSLTVTEYFFKPVVVIVWYLYF